MYYTKIKELSSLIIFCGKVNIKPLWPQKCLISNIKAV